MDTTDKGVNWTYDDMWDACGRHVRLRNGETHRVTMHSGGWDIGAY
jgi:hypothetical protein